MDGEVGGKKASYHETQVPPLVQEVPVDIDTVRFAQIL